MLQNTSKTLGSKKYMVYKNTHGGGGHILHKKRADFRRGAFRHAVTMLTKVGLQGFWLIVKML